MSFRCAARWLLLVALLALILWTVWNRDELDAAAFEAWLNELGAFAAVAFVLAYVLGSLLFAPGSVMTLVAGAAFGPILGTLLSLIGATLGATAAFLVARFVGREWASDWLKGRRLGELVRGIEEDGWRFVAFVRLVPLFPYNVLNYALGLTAISLRQYVLASLVCMAPGAAAFSYLGHSGRRALDAGDTGTAIQTALIGLAIVATLAFLLPRIAKRLRRTRSA